MFRKNVYYKYVQSFNHVITLPTLKDVKQINDLFKERNIPIFGYYFNRTFFSKEDLMLHFKEKKYILLNLKKKILKIKKIYIKIINM